MYKILAINPGSTSTKISVFLDKSEVLKGNLVHTVEELNQVSAVVDQFDYRWKKIMTFLKENQIECSSFSAVVGRGGAVKPVAGGIYFVNDIMLDDLRNCRYGSHASNLGALLAKSFAETAGCEAYIIDPIVVDELDPVARITGRPEIPKKSIFHALNQKAVARRFAEEILVPYDKLNLIVAHLGGGISVGCHKKGRVVDVNNAVHGNGPFSPERAGTVQAYQFAEYILNRELNHREVEKELAGRGGLVAHLGTNDARNVEEMIAEGDEKAKLVYDAMIYQIARYIAAAAIPVCGKVDYIIVTGGMAYSEYIIKHIKEYVAFIAPVVIIPGENEMLALAEGAYRVLSGKEFARHYC